MHHTLHIFQIIHRRAQHRLPPVTVTQCKPGKVKRRLLHCLQTMQLKIRTKVRKPNFGSKSVPELEPELGGLQTPNNVAERMCTREGQWKWPVWQQKKSS